MPFIFNISSSMELKRPLFNRINNCISIVVLIIASFTYLSTIEPTVSFWDCGEFIASSYKLEVGHPPGNPVFQVIARFFTLFASPENAAMMVNAMSALCSALTIFFLYFTIVHLARRIMEKQGKIMDMGNAIGIFGAGIVGSLAYCWSDTFWFSAVEGEVYAMSSLFTAIVFWAMLKWEEQADQPYANRWIILIAFLMGLSIGVHLLNLLTIPALVFLYYFKKLGYFLRRNTIQQLIRESLLNLLVLSEYFAAFVGYTQKVFTTVIGIHRALGEPFLFQRINHTHDDRLIFTGRYGYVLENLVGARLYHVQQDKLLDRKLDVGLGGVPLFQYAVQPVAQFTDGCYQ